ncbi:MAG: fluoride efflux transporter CrcB [Pseudomonadota bacterium]
MEHSAIIFLGGGLGAVGRHLVGLFALRHLGAGFPYGTLFVNVAGSLLIGLMIGIFAHRGAIGSSWQLFFTTGVLGGFTTFSAFSLDTLNLWQRGEVGLAAGYVAGTVAVSLLAVFVGLAISRIILPVGS